MTLGKFITDTCLVSLTVSLIWPRLYDTYYTGLEADKWNS